MLCSHRFRKAIAMLKLSSDQERRVSTPGGPVQRNLRKTSLLQQTYLPLLVVTTMTSALFCYLYLTSTSIPSASIEELRASLAQAETPKDAAVAGSSEEPETEEESWLPVGNTLPSKAPDPSKPASNAQGTEKLVDVNAPVIAQKGLYEPTNQEVEYAMIAELKDGRLQKINATLPAAYKSRHLAVNPEDRRRAEFIFSRLTQLHKNMGTLQRESELLLREWNGLVVRSTPYEVLRADSPSLYGTDQELPPSRIKISEPEPTPEPEEANGVKLPPADAGSSATIDLR